MVDRGTIDNVMSIDKLQKTGEGFQDLIKTNMILKDFDGIMSQAK
jgi:hypothetical protein